MQRRWIGLLVALLILLGALGLFAYYRVQENRYVSTDNARVAADLVPVGPEIPGRLLSLRVRPGDQVEAGEVLGEVSTETLAQSAQANPQAIPQVAPLAANRALILAPGSGTVVQVAATVGQYLGAGQAALYLADLDQVAIAANVDEGAVHRIRLGQRVEVRVDALPGKVLQGVVEEVGEAAASAFSLLPDANANAGNFTKVTQVVPVRVGLLEKPPVPLGPGMSAAVRFHVAEPPVAVSASLLRAEARERPIRLVAAGATVGESVAVVSEVSGTVERVLVGVGDGVRPGQLLVQLQDQALMAQLRAGEAALRQAREGLRQAEVAYQQAERVYRRVEALYQVGAASRQDLETAKAQRDTAYLQYRTAREALLPQAASNLEALQVRAGKLQVRSPISGRVASRGVDPGQTVGPGQVLLPGKGGSFPLSGPLARASGLLGPSRRPGPSGDPRPRGLLREGGGRGGLGHSHGRVLPGGDPAGRPRPPPRPSGSSHLPGPGSGPLPSPDGPALAWRPGLRLRRPGERPPPGSRGGPSRGGRGGAGPRPRGRGPGSPRRPRGLGGGGAPAGGPLTPKPWRLEGLPRGRPMCFVLRLRAPKAHSQGFQAGLSQGWRGVTEPPAKRPGPPPGGGPVQTGRRPPEPRTG